LYSSFSVAVSNGGAQQSVLRNYTYDGADRLPSYTEPGAGLSQAYGYDAFGNMWQNGTAAGVPALRTTSSSQYLMAGPSVRNRLTTVTYDAAGNQTQLQPENGITASYDGEGRMSQVLSSGVAIATYGYDGEGRRVSKSLMGTGTTYYVYSADGELMAEYGMAPAGGSATTQYVVTDQLGSARMLLNADGTCNTSLDYAPFGGQITRSAPCYLSSPVVGLPEFTGQLRDGETVDASRTGTDYFGARYFWGALGRFASPDYTAQGSDPVPVPSADFDNPL
jgi:YD repeat-containing protein